MKQRISLAHMDGSFILYAQIPALEKPVKIVFWKGLAFLYTGHNDGTTWQYEQSSPFFLQDMHVEGL
jgi:hypothetical protein